MSISEIERGVVDPRRSTLERLARAFGFSGVDALEAEAAKMRGADERDQPGHTRTGEHPQSEVEPFDRDIGRGYKKRDVPVIGDAEASTNGIIAFDDEGLVRAQIEQWVSRSFADGDPRAYALRVRGDSMVPRYFPGEIVIAQPRLNVRDGDFACVQFVNGERLVKTSGLYKTWQTACGRENAIRAKVGRNSLPHIRVYDLRHSFLTWAAGLVKDDRALKHLARSNQIARYTMGSEAARLESALQVLQGVRRTQPDSGGSRPAERLVEDRTNTQKP